MNFKFIKGYDNIIILDLESRIVNVGIRRLNVYFNHETAIDLSAYHGIDIEQELISVLSGEIATLIDNVNTLINIQINNNKPHFKFLQ